MALEAWLDLLKSPVAGVAAVRGPTHAGLAGNSLICDHVASVTQKSLAAQFATAKMPPLPVPLHSKPAWTVPCTAATSVTPSKTSPDAEQEKCIGQKYYSHHFQCLLCIAAGRGSTNCRRCSLGNALWHSYVGTLANSVEESDR